MQPTILQMLRFILSLAICSLLVGGCRSKLNIDSRGGDSSETRIPSAFRDDTVDNAVAATDTIPPARDTATSRADSNIRVETPKANQRIASGKIELSGTARTFENGLSYRLVGADGTTLTEGHLKSSGEMGRFNPYRTSIQIPPGADGEMRLEVFQYSAKDGSEIDRTIVPLKVEGAAGGMTQLQVFLTNPRMGSGVDCQKVLPVIRSVPHTTEVAAAALDQLLRGPTGADADGGYRSEIPAGTSLKRVTIENGAARADFSAELNHVAGSCRVVAIRAQIERTLRQFPTVKSVTISVEGKSIGVLQP